MNNLLPYFGLVEARISASEKDLPVKIVVILSVAQLLTTVIFSSQLEIGHVLNGTTPKIQHRNWGP